MAFEPIAVVGRGCVLPDAPDPDPFWDNIAAGRCSLSAGPGGQVAAAAPVGHGHRGRPPRPYVDRCRRVRDGTSAESDSDPGFPWPPTTSSALDPLFHWVLHGGRQALREAGREGPLPRAGLVLGNLSYPTSAGSAFAEHVWLSQGAPPCCPRPYGPRPDARNRFSLRAARPLRGPGPRAGRGRLRARRRLRLRPCTPIKLGLRPPARRYRGPHGRRCGQPGRPPVPARGVLRRCPR